MEVSEGRVVSRSDKEGGKLSNFKGESNDGAARMADDWTSALKVHNSWCLIAQPIDNSE